MNFSAPPVEVSVRSTPPVQAIARWPLSVPNNITANEWWFDAFDQRRFVVGNRRYTTQVVGVHIQAFDTWIQIEFAEVPGRSLLLHVPPGAGVPGAVKAIEALIHRRT